MPVDPKNAMLDDASTSCLSASLCANPDASSRNTRGTLTTPIMLHKLSAFHIGGHTVRIDNQPLTTLRTVPGLPPRKSDPNGHYQIGQLYAQHYALQSPRSPHPVLFWHGGGMTGAAWGDTPDGRPGWHDYFMRHGFDTCVSDAVERGRASWAPYPLITPEAPEHRTMEQAWSIFRFGPADASGKAFDGQKFPIDAIHQLAKQFVARWSCNTELAVAAYIELLRKFDRAIIVAHSEGARYAQQVASQVPELIEAIVLIEPAGSPDPNSSDATHAARVPHLVIWGDYIDHSELWQNYRAQSDVWLQSLRQQGGRVNTLNLVEQGVTGNSHLLMMDYNSDDIAKYVVQWLNNIQSDI